MLLAFTLGIAFLGTLLNFVLATFRIGPFTQDSDGSAVRNIGLVLAALLSAPFVVWRSVVAAKQADTAAEALFNDKINAAAQGLLAHREVTLNEDSGETLSRFTEYEDDLVARVAAIDRLEGLAIERKDASPRITKLLAAYVRGNFPCPNLEPTEGLKLRKVPRIDLQKTIDTLGRIYELAALQDQSHWRLDLTHCDLDGVNFNGGFFRAADFSESRLEAAILDSANCEGARLQGTLLNFCSFRNTNLFGARFDRATVNRPPIRAGAFSQSLNLANIRGATFIAADLSALNHLGNTEVLSSIFVTKDTIIASEIRRKMLDPSTHEYAHDLYYRSSKESLSDEDLSIVEKLTRTGFLHWSPYDSTDWATGSLLSDFRQELDIDRWPFTG